MKIFSIPEDCDVTPCEEYEFEDFLQILSVHKSQESNEKLLKKLEEADPDKKGYLRSRATIVIIRHEKHKLYYNFWA